MQKAITPGEFLTKVRNKTGLTQSEFAKKISATQQFVSRAESNRLGFHRQKIAQSCADKYRLTDDERNQFLQLVAHHVLGLMLPDAITPKIKVFEGATQLSKEDLRWLIKALQAFDTADSDK